MIIFSTKWCILNLQKSLAALQIHFLKALKGVKTNFKGGNKHGSRH
jgi:hypothetical protein